MATARARAQGQGQGQGPPLALAPAQVLAPLAQLVALALVPAVARRWRGVQAQAVTTAVTVVVTGAMTR